MCSDVSHIHWPMEEKQVWNNKVSNTPSIYDFILGISLFLTHVFHTIIIIDCRSRCCCTRFVLLLCVCAGKSVRFLHTVCSTAVIFLALQCGMQIPFTYIPKHGEILNTSGCSLHDHTHTDIIWMFLFFSDWTMGQCVLSPRYCQVW